MLISSFFFILNTSKFSLQDHSFLFHVAAYSSPFKIPHATPLCAAINIPLFRGFNFTVNQFMIMFVGTHKFRKILLQFFETAVC